MTPDPPPIPILPYAAHPTRPPWWRWSLAITSAARFATLSLLFEILASMLIASRYAPQSFLSRDMFAFWILYLILSIPTFIITIFSCWLRLDVTAHSLARRTPLWPFAAIYVAITTALAFATTAANVNGQIQNPLALIGLWYLGAPALSCFFLLRKSNLINTPS